MYSAGKMSRRQALRGLTAVGAGTLLGCSQTHTIERQLGPSASTAAADTQAPKTGTGTCLSGNTINGLPLHTQSNPGGQPGAQFEHQIQTGFFRTTHFSHENQSASNVTHLLAIDVGILPDDGVFHPMEQSDMGTGNRIDCIMVFAQTGAACDQLVYWRKFTAQDQSPSTMIVLDDSLLSSNLRIVVKCAQHGFWGTDLNLALTQPLDYATQVPQLNGTLPFGGITTRRPYIQGAGLATGGQGDLGAIHMPEITIIDNNTVTVTQGANGARHPKFGENHYIAGAVIFDQNGSPLAMAQAVVFGSTDISKVTFTDLSLVQRNVKTIRAVTFDTLQGMFMGFKAVT
jgi:desulfoferrodoxin (superoxide reductase-like protein)